MHTKMDSTLSRIILSLIFCRKHPDSELCLVVLVEGGSIYSDRWHRSVYRHSGRVWSSDISGRTLFLIVGHDARNSSMREGTDRWDTKVRRYGRSCRWTNTACRWTCNGQAASAVQREETPWCDRTSASLQSGMLWRWVWTEVVRDGWHTWSWKCCCSSPCDWWQMREQAFVLPQLITNGGWFEAGGAAKSTDPLGTWCGRRMSVLCRQWKRGKSLYSTPWLWRHQGRWMWDWACLIVAVFPARWSLFCRHSVSIDLTSSIALFDQCMRRCLESWRRTH